MMRGKPASLMQKTYDDAYLICSTAIYFENQNNEAEALRSWKNALDQIYYHNAYRVPANYRPKSETEKALQESLKELELQCKERVDLLEALKTSRTEAEESKKATTSGDGPAQLDSPMAASTQTNGQGGQGIPGWLGGGTVRPVDYPQLARPPPLPQRPLLMTQRSAGEPSRPHSYHQNSSTSELAPLSATSSAEPPQKKSRTPSPTKKGGMLRTLRPGGRDNAKGSSSSLRPNLRNKPPAAAKAATQAWGTPGFQNSADNLAAATARLSVSAASSSLAPPQRRPSLDDRRRVSSDRNRITDDNNRSAENLLRIPSSQTAHSSLQATMPETVPEAESSKKKTYYKPDPISYRKEYRVMDPHTRRLIPEALNHSSKNADEPESGEVSNPSPKDSKPKIRRKAVGGHKNTKPRQITQLSDDETSPDHARPYHKASRRKQPVAERITSNLTPSESSSNDVSEPEFPTASESKEWRARVARIMKRLPKGVDEAAAKQILNEIVIHGDEVHWSDIAGLDAAKSALKETVVYPFLRPDLFMGLREPARGMLLFGPPGTGKTMLARAVATESKSTFFAISASSLTSKYLGESEKLVRALFALAKALAPSIIFVDEIDSLLSSRSGSSEHEATRRIKTEFLIQWSDLARAAAGRETSEKDKEKGDASRVLVLAATNLPWAIDEAARRRFVRRQYIPLPEDHVRAVQIRTLLSHQKHSLSDGDIDALVQLTNGFSGSDITALAKDAAMGPLRSLGEKLLHMTMDEIRPMSFVDFEASLVSIRPSVSRQGLKQYEDWAQEFGERGG
ncbi:AAA-domain-containing protein [Rhizodiscina lignyota]|uniref:AAA-domain-containing protein n=1 Tax=Rhizodiscina lignyota TaxID=1504668 RepID=A0A9P4IB91_9PEZI|nr:AAA-domain-containing protein [Rhizodiscina lignyota]